MSKRYFWLKFQTDFFQNPLIKKLRKIAGGDTYTIIYLKLQLLSVPNGGFIKLQGIEPDPAEELALIINEESENIAVTLNFLVKYGLMELVEESAYFLPEASSNIGSETESAARMRRMRALQAAGCERPATALLEERHIVTIEGDKEKDIDIDIDIEGKVSLSSVKSAFIKTFGRSPDKSFCASIMNIVGENADFSSIKVAFSSAVKNNPDRIEPYVIAALKKEIEQKTANPPLGKWEQIWLAEHKRIRAAQK